MEKETELYLIKQIHKLEDELDYYHKEQFNPTFYGYNCQDLYNKAKAFDELVEALELTYDPKSFSLIIKSCEHLSVKNLPNLYLTNMNIDAILRGLNIKL